jgi:predicted Fe-Mo cluster-binding NifX family protein
MKLKRVAIPVFEKRVSPLFDVAGEFVIYDINDTNIINSEYFQKHDFSVTSTICLLKERKINLVICSAISKCSSRMITNLNIEVISGIIGAVDDVIAAYVQKKLKNEKFIMPGCLRRRNNCLRRKKRSKENLNISKKGELNENSNIFSRE